MDSLLPWVQRCGLVLYAPRGQQFACPAPTLVEAVLGAPTPASSVADREPARALLGRMVAEGTALPLNLLGAPGITPDEPDFVVAAAVFPYLFTLRGDKAYKQLPSSSGLFKVSPLAVNTYTMLSESGPRSATDLANELGKGLTEAAVLRGLSELWQHLRVFPVSQTDGTTLWELATARFTKAIKSGANAGQPSALSALITLYLGQAVLATADDVELFLSPLAPRSRVRDVVHALAAARELGEIVVEGKHVLHVTGDLPVFDSATAAEPAEAGAQMEGEGRIKKFGTGVRKPAFQKAKPFAGADRERRPFDRARGPVRKPAAGRDGASPTGSGSPPTFDRPWDEERAARTARAESSAAEEGVGPETQDIDLDAQGDAPGAEATEAPRPSASRPIFDRPKKAFGKPAFGDRKKPFGDRAKPSFGARPRPSFGDRGSAERTSSPGDRPSYGDRKAFGSRPKPSFGDRPRPSFNDRPRGDRPPSSDRPRSDRPAFGDRPRPSFGDRPRLSSGDRSRPDRPPFGDREARGGGRPSFGDRPRGGGGDRPAFSRNRDGAGSDRPAFRPAGDRPFRPRADAAGDGGAPSKRPSRPGFDRGAAGDRPAFRPAGDRPFRARPDAGGDARPPRRDFSGGDARPPRRDFTGKPFERTSRPRAEGVEGGRPPFKRFDARPSKPGGFSARPAPGGKLPYTASTGGKPASGKSEGPFDKFKGNAKPWGKRPPKRKIKPEEGGSDA